MSRGKCPVGDRAENIWVVAAGLGMHKCYSLTAAYSGLVRLDYEDECVTKPRGFSECFGCCSQGDSLVWTLEEDWGGPHTSASSLSSFRVAGEWLEVGPFMVEAYSLTVWLMSGQSMIELGMWHP